MDTDELLRTVRISSSAVDEARKMYAYRLAPEFSPFDFIQPDESRLSSILAWLLNPKGKHSQGGRFLRLMFDRLGFNWPLEFFEQAKVETEAQIQGGRIDILITARGHALAIENKPWASDQKTQLSRYFAHLDKLGMANKCLVYLTPEGQDPTVDSICEEERRKRIDDGQLYLLSYCKDIVEWLAKCRGECEADRVSVFVDQLSRYVRKTFEGAKDMTMRDRLVDEVTRSVDTVSPTMDILIAADAIRGRLIKNLQNQLEPQISQRGWSLEVYDNPYYRYNGIITVHFSDTCPYNFCLQFQNTFYNGLIFGLTRLKDKAEVAHERTRLIESVGQGNESSDWIWYRYPSPTDSLFAVEQNWQLTAEPWIAIANGTMANNVVSVASQFYAVLKLCEIVM
jgi:hypothetical protein